ncbi:MAG TPA: iron-containing alcohol dehydrogenase [Candidatus Limivivens merdigallinarum]|uniref:Iron-containing alcohol dehydrogenase n=1 Tax=Candidatus Limivivens merdigallinarum TaxID=2840859 RepID=A0A9D1D034_9FIRM|nr:iron-containing alcohol dehydrogenase [Candidatus Limivivens merdigallinarum]
MHSFDIRTKIYYGEGALDRLTQIPYKKVLIITDPFVVQSGMIMMISSRLEEAQIEFDVFKDVVPDPPIEKVVKGVKVVLEYQPEAIVAVGGGSAIDSAKAIREFARQMGNMKQVALIAIPTTSGTGSEVTSFSVISDPEEHRKYPLVSDDLLPTEAILDAELTRSVPPAITADTGMDVFTHALEAYVSTDSTEFSAALSEKAIEICGTFLLRAYLDGNDTHARKKMHIASCLAGLAFNAASLGINHSLAHQLGARFHIPHGRANAMLLPHIIEYNSMITKNSRSQKTYPRQVEKYCTVARLLGVQNFNTVTTIRALVAWVQFNLREMDIPLSISQTGKCTRAEYFQAISDMAEAALEDACTATNPRIPNKDDIMEIYEKLW